MNNVTVTKAIREAKRFVEAAEAARKHEEATGNKWFGSPLSATCRRRSMDLTRALAEMRK